MVFLKNNGVEILLLIDKDGFYLNKLYFETRYTLPWLVKILNKMEKHGLITRQCEGSNNRRKIIHLTQKGRIVADSIKKIKGVYKH